MNNIFGPGYSGFVAKRQLNEQEDAGDLKQALGFMNLQNIRSEMAAREAQQGAAAQKQGLVSALNQQQPMGGVGDLNPAQEALYRSRLFASQGLLQEAKQWAEIAEKWQDKLEMKDGVWYDKTTGKAVRGGAMMNNQGFGVQMNVGPQGQISAGQLPGAAQQYAQQQAIGEQQRAAHDLVTVPAGGPNQAPYMASRASILRSGQVPAGMTPNVSAQLQADTAQQTEVSKNYASIYNNLQNASMANPAKMAKFQQIGSLLGEFEGGKFSKTGLELSRAFNSAGLKIDPKLSNKEAAEALTNEVALELRSTAGGAGMPGAMSDADREFLKSMTPQMSQTAEGRKSIIESRVKVMERENRVASMARAYRQKYGKLDEAFFSQLQEWSNRNEIFKQ
jgi:hypothetical protein